MTKNTLFKLRFDYFSKIEAFVIFDSITGGWKQENPPNIVVFTDSGFEKLCNYGDENMPF